MKKFALMLASAMLVLSAASAMAAVPSKTTVRILPFFVVPTDVTHVKSVETVKEDGKTEAAGWDIDVTEDEAPVIEEIAKIYDWVAAKGKSAVSYFPEETQQAIAALLPEGFKLENMTMNEFVTLMLTGDVDALNDAKVVLTFTTKYTQDQHVVVVIGLYDGTRDANGQYVVTWIPLEAEVLENGDIAVVFPAEVSAQMKDAVATAMAVLND